MTNKIKDGKKMNAKNKLKEIKETRVNQYYPDLQDNMDWLINRVQRLTEALDRIDEIAFQNGYHSITTISLKALEEE